MRKCQLSNAHNVPGKRKSHPEVRRPLCRLQILLLSSKGIGLLALDWREVTQRGVWTGSNELCRGWNELCTATKRFQLGSLWKIIHLSSFSFSRLGFFISPVQERHQISECLSAVSFSYHILILCEFLRYVMERVSICCFFLDIYSKFWILCDHFSAGFKVDPYSFVMDFNC